MGAGLAWQVIYAFEDYHLDPGRRELRRGGRLVATEPQVFDLLVYLVRNRDRVVSGDDLIAAVWNGRIVSESTLSSRITAVRHAVDDSGERQRLIRTVIRKGFRFVGDVREEKDAGEENATVENYGQDFLATAHAAVAPVLSLPDKPSIAVLPFANLSGDPDQEYFADGITEELTTALSQFRWLFVIARSSSFTYKRRPVDVKRVGRELGVRYLLEGSVRKAADRLRISAQLIDASTGAQMWANRFDGDLEDVFGLQDQVTASVVGTIGPKLEQAEIERAKRKTTESLDAYDYYLRGLDSLYRWTEEGISDALRLFDQAIAIDPAFACAYGMAAYCYVQRKSYGWFTDRPHEVAEAGRLARRAVELGPGDAIALSKAAHALASVVRDIDSGAAFIDQALLLNPNLAAGWYVSGWVRVFCGEPETALKHHSRAIRLSPFDPLIFKVHAAIAHAHFFAGRYDEASDWAEKAVRAGPNYLTGIRASAASHALAGRLDEAQKRMAHMRARDPVLRLSNLKDLLPLRRPQDFARWSDALHRAGLPA
jgi:TolB-like protein